MAYVSLRKCRFENKRLNFTKISTRLKKVQFILRDATLIIYV